MYKNSDYSNLIYEYFFTRFQFQYYHYGERLPSIDILCRKFSVSDKTVKAALQRLRSEGYISMHNGMATQVLFQQTEAEMKQNILRFFSERWNYFYDVFCSSELIFVPLMLEGLHRMDEQDFAYLSELASQASFENLMLIYCYILQKLKNPLVMNLYWEISMFLGFPIFKNQNSKLFNTALIKKTIKELISFGRAKDWDKLRTKLCLYQRSFVNKVIDILKPYIQVNSQKEQTSFFWRIYWEHPQICYSLAIQIMHKINWEEFEESDFLPSYEKMAEQYGVSVITIRRTIRFLNQIGAVHTINGKGTRILRLGDAGSAIDFSSLAVRRSLAYFMQATEIVFYTCEDVTKTTLTGLSKEEKIKLVSIFDGYLKTKHCERSIWSFFIFISNHHSLQGLREIYWKLYGLFLWGYPLKNAYEKVSEFESDTIEFTKSMVQYLKANDIESCMAAVKKLLGRSLLLTKNHLLLHGLTLEELQLSPSIQFLPKENTARETTDF